MKSRLLYFVAYYFFWVLAFVVQKPVFMLYQWETSKSYGLADWLRVVWNGLSMDFSTAGYLSVPVLLLLLVSCFTGGGRWLNKTIRVLGVVLLTIVVMGFVADMFLYPFWGYRLDVTPLFYMETPKNAVASGTMAQNVACVACFVIEWLAYFFAFRFVHKKAYHIDGRSFLSAAPLLLLTGVLFVVIRGGVTVSVMNAGRAYFSKDMFLNHSAVNPIWNFFSSFAKEDDFASQYRFMDDAEAHRLMAEMSNPVTLPADTFVLKNKRPNIVVFILESFGSNICGAAGGAKGLTPNLDRMAAEGLFFSNFYANSYRTDRGLVAILSAYPGQPVTSLMKYPEKSQNVPTLPGVLKQNGYDLSFYYGGDEDFTNMRSYLLHAGFEKRVCDKNFSSDELSTKWGAYDHVVINRLIDDLKKPQQQPFCKVLLTLNSHEPFDVPFQKFADPYPNSVAYTDSCLGVFYDFLKASPCWDNTLFILLPDHAKPYPETMTNQEVARYQAPMIWTGGAVKGPMVVSQMGSQIDLARTLLAQLDIDGSDFVFSKNIFSEKSPKFAFYAYNDGLGFVTPEGASVFDCGGNVSLREDNPQLTVRGKAFLQCLMDDLAKR